MNLAELGETFRNARISANLTQHQVAGMSGVSRTRISLFETGALPEIGAARMINLFGAVGLQLATLPSGQERTGSGALQAVAEAGPTQPGKPVSAKAAEHAGTPLEA